MLVDKTVKVEQEIDAVLVEVKSVVAALKSGKSVTDVAIGELLRLQSVLQNAVAVPADIKESLPAAVRTVLLDAEDLALTILGVA